MHMHATLSGLYGFAKNSTKSGEGKVMGLKGQKRGARKKWGAFDRSIFMYIKSSNSNFKNLGDTWNYDYLT